MGDARHSNTRAAADIYFQLVEECEIPAGGSLVEYVDDMREKLEAAEKRIAELETNFAALAVENVGLNKFIKDDCFIYTSDDISPRDANGFKPETPATDALLAEVRAQGVDMARNAMIDFVDGEVGPNKNVPGLIRGAEICVSIAEQLRKGGNQ
ncbi:hypothetical protein SM861_005205 [Escherichia coli]|nr:hypothetical protein [Escherichia coli]